MQLCRLRIINNLKVLKQKDKRSILNILKETEAQFKNKGIASPRLDAEVLFSYYLSKDRSFLYTNHEYVLTDEELREFERGVVRRLKGEPVAYITGRKEFWSLEFEVNHTVLIPRPETEILVEEILRLSGQRKPLNGKILEIGTGSGAISVALAPELKKYQVFATDISIDAIRVAKRNARRNGVGNMIFFFCGNLFEPLSSKFDFIVSNPPYITENEFQHLPIEVREFEPKEALIAGPEGIEFHRKLIKGGGTYLKRGGWLVLEIGHGQSRSIERMLRETQNYDYITFQTDYAGVKRIAAARRRE